jgi:hypothetical protein
VTARPPTIEYASPRPRYKPTRQDRIWLLRRIGYCLGQLALFLVLSFWVGPYLVLLIRYGGDTPERFAAVAQARYAGIVAAIKAYQRDEGALPGWVGQARAYWPNDYRDDGADLLFTTRMTFVCRDPYGVIVYEFAAADEGWRVYSPRYNGPLPAPLVQAAPATRPTATESVSGD